MVRAGPAAASPLPTASLAAPSLVAWSVGVNLFVLLTGAFPFGPSAKTAPELFHSIKHDPIAWGPNSVSLSLAVRQLLVDLLQKVR